MRWYLSVDHQIQHLEHAGGEALFRGLIVKQILLDLFDLLWEMDKSFNDVFVQLFTRYAVYHWSPQISIDKYCGCNAASGQTALALCLAYGPTY